MGSWWSGAGSACRAWGMAAVLGSRAGRRLRRGLVLLTVPVLGAGSVAVPASVVVAGVAAAGVASVAVGSAPARASTTCAGSVLVFPGSVNGGSSSAEAAEAASLGCTVTLFSSSAVSGMTQAQMIAYFSGFTAI